MLLIPQINSIGDLLLDAYSFSSDEINSVAFVLEKANIEIVNERLLKDIQERYGLRFLIMKSEIHKLERTLNLKFNGIGENTKAVFDPVYANADGQGNAGKSFKCSRIDTPPNSCKTIYAKDEREATVKCALFANSENWLGGVPTPGRC
jgi:hypothetical protein